MRRVEMISGVREIQTALKETHVYDLLVATSGVQQSKGVAGEAMSAVLSVFKEYSVRASNYSESARKLVEIFGLKRIEDPEFWGRIVSPDEKSRLNVRKAISSVDFAVEYLPQIAKMIRQEPFYAIGQDNKGGAAQDATKGLVSLLLAEGDSLVSTPLRLAEALTAVASLYEVSARLLGLNPQDLVVVACDSGTDKSFDLLGAADAIKNLKDIILSLWDRVVFYREKKLFQHLELVKESLPVIKQISDLQANGKLGPEDAEILRRKVLDGVGGLLKSGAIIPEIITVSHIDALALMTPEPKLLASGPTRVLKQDTTAPEQV